MTDLMVHSRADFEARLNTFVAGCKRIRAEYDAQTGFENRSEWNVHWLKRWVRIEGSDKVHCFVDIETGEVLKPQGWKRPAITKVRRGNIFDEHNGLKHMTPFGPAYAEQLREEH